MIEEVLKKFINNVPHKSKYQGGLSVSLDNILGISLLTEEEAKVLPRNIRACGKWYWLKDKGFSSNYAPIVDDDGYVFSSGYGVYFNDGAVRPVLFTNLESSNLQLHDIYIFFDFDVGWYYIGEGKFLSVKPIGNHRFDSESNDYETSEIK